MGRGGWDVLPPWATTAWRSALHIAEPELSRRLSAESSMVYVVAYTRNLLKDGAAVFFFASRNEIKIKMLL